MNRSLMNTPDYASLADSHIWYVCYGSNLRWQRFSYYLKGGFCPLNGKTYAGCDNTSDPLESRAVHVPYDLYFGGASHVWEDGGVGFLDPTRTGDAYARAWLVTKDQYEQVRDQEGRDPEWYCDQVDLEPIEGIFARTFTNAVRREKNAPSEPYLDVIRRGLRETFPQLTAAEVDEYLVTCSER